MLAAMLAIPAGASAQWFTVEIVVFDEPDGEELHAEHWSPDPGEPSLRSAVELTFPHEDDPDDAALAYRLLHRSDLALDDVRRALRRSARYRPFLHVGWRLPGLRYGAARPVHVSPRLGNDGNGGGERPVVRGTVKVSLARYLQVDLDLIYGRPGNDETAAPGAAPTRFRLVTRRRMRSGELHYIDHPLFGVLVLIEPYQTTP